MKLTDFTFYRNTPFTDFQNTILFDTNKERDNYFDSGVFGKLNFSNYRFNFIRDRGTIRLPISYDSMLGINYCHFDSEFEDGTRFYAFVMNYTYLNDNAVEVELLIDVIMTFCQGDTLSTFKNLSVTRKHLPKAEYKSRAWELRNNDDVVKTHTKRYTDNNEFLFNDLSAIMQVSCSLTADFGDVDDPKIVSSEGITFDRITSPVNLYVVKKSKFNTLMKELSPYAWITQNIRSVSLIPSILVDGKTEKVNPKSIDFNDLEKLMHGGTTENNYFENVLQKISKTDKQMHKMFGLDPEEDRHLMRNEYTTTEVYTFTGDELFIDNSQLSEKEGLKFNTVYVTGYHNEVAVYVENYKAKGGVDGSFLNDAIFIKNFDDVPIMIDNYNLSMSKSANQRKHTESKLASNRLGNIADSGADPKDRFMDAAGLATNLSPMNFFSKFTDEHDYYKQQQAEEKDLALNTDTVTDSSNNNSLAIARDFFGITVKHAQPTPTEWKKIKTYYKMFGYHVNDENATVDPRNMTVCDYVQFSGQFMINGIDISLNEMLKAQFENGVRFWHHNGKDRPMEQDIMDNKMRD